MVLVVVIVLVLVCLQFISTRTKTRQTVGGYDPLYCPKFREIKSRLLPEFDQKCQFTTKNLPRNVLSGNAEPLKI